MDKAFSDDELNIIRTIRSAEIRVDHEGRLKIHHAMSDEYCAAMLHKLLRPTLAVEP